MKDNYSESKSNQIVFIWCQLIAKVLHLWSNQTPNKPVHIQSKSDEETQPLTGTNLDQSHILGEQMSSTSHKMGPSGKKVPLQKLSPVFDLV